MLKKTVLTTVTAIGAALVISSAANAADPSCIVCGSGPITDSPGLSDAIRSTGPTVAHGVDPGKLGLTPKPPFQPQLPPGAFPLAPGGGGGGGGGGLPGGPGGLAPGGGGGGGGGGGAPGGGAPGGGGSASGGGSSGGFGGWGSGIGLGLALGQMGSHGKSQRVVHHYYPPAPAYYAPAPQPVYQQPVYQQPAQQQPAVAQPNVLDVFIGRLVQLQQLRQQDLISKDVFKDKRNAMVDQFDAEAVVAQVGLVKGLEATKWMRETDLIDGDQFEDMRNDLVEVL